MKKSGNGKGAFGRSRSGRPARRRVSINTHIAFGVPLIVAVVLVTLFTSIKTGLVVAIVGALIWGGAVLYRAQRRSFQRV